MNAVEHLLACLAEEGGEITQDATKCLRFGVHDRNVLDPTGPDNAERLANELNDLIAVAQMLTDVGVLPVFWMDQDKIAAKKAKVVKFMAYASRVGALQGGAK